jgi:hypothetical protein
MTNLNASATRAFSDLVGEPKVALSMDEFAQAVRHALRDLHRPLALRENPLLFSRLIAHRVGSRATVEERVVALHRIVRQAAEALRDAPRAKRVFPVLEATYLVEAPPQEVVSEELDLPFSTYRYQLKQAVTRVVERLWQAQIVAH